MGIIILISTLFINLIITDNSDSTDLTFSNIEALAEDESPDATEDNKKPTCVESGFICTGIDKNGTSGNHPGLRETTEK